LEIPVVSICATGKLDGTCTVDAPAFRLGYADAKEPLRLAVYATIDPPLVVGEQNTAELGSAESHEVIVRAQKWLAKVERSVPEKRRFGLMARLPTGQSVIASRTVFPLPPPPGFATPSQILRFVSVLPLVRDSASADAVLLCNYLKYGGVDAYVVLGFDLVNGSTAFVVSKVAGKITLYNPIQGVAWSSKDRFCSLYSVGVVFNDQNVWANVQKDSEVYRIDWNFSDTRKWFPFFTVDFSKPPLGFSKDDGVRSPLSRLSRFLRTTE
jgi:coiled-coil and C2 domain-containing protein 2A